LCSGSWRYAGGNGNGDAEDTPGAEVVKEMWTLALVFWVLQGPPTVAGLWLGDPPNAVRAQLGEPERRQTSLGMDFWDYDRRGLSLIWDLDRTTLRVIVLKKSGAGVIEGLRVGDNATQVRARWGAPARARQHGRFVDFTRPQWVQTVEVRDGHVVEITVTAR